MTTYSLAPKHFNLHIMIPSIILALLLLAIAHIFTVNYEESNKQYMILSQDIMIEVEAMDNKLICIWRPKFPLDNIWNPIGSLWYILNEVLFITVWCMNIHTRYHISLSIKLYIFQSIVTRVSFIEPEIWKIPFPFGF